MPSAVRRQYKRKLCMVRGSPICNRTEAPMKHLTLTVLAAAVMASGALAQHKEDYNLNAATADLAVFHKLARDGVLRREDAQPDLNFGARFGEADFDRDGVVTAAEMDQYIRRTYEISSISAGNET